MDGSDSAFPSLPGAAPGLTKREWFAGMALGGLAADGVRKADMAQFAVIVADQIIDELNGNGKKSP